MNKKQAKKALDGFNSWLALLDVRFYLKNKRTLHSIRAILERELSKKEGGEKK